MDCKHCGKPIVLVPSAKERARRYGGKPEDYTRLFDYHAACTLALREKSLTELMARLRNGTIHHREVP